MTKTFGFGVVDVAGGAGVAQGGCVVAHGAAVVAHGAGVVADGHDGAGVAHPQWPCTRPFRIDLKKSHYSRRN